MILIKYVVVTLFTYTEKKHAPFYFFGIEHIIVRYNKLAQEQLRIPTIRSYEEDQNRDGMNDMLHLEMEVPLSDKEMMQGVSILLMFDYRLHNMASVSMEAAAYFEYSNGVPGSSLFVDGDLTLKQREALPWFGQRTTYEEPIVNMNSYNADDYDLVSVRTARTPRRPVCSAVTRIYSAS